MGTKFGHSALVCVAILTLAASAKVAAESQPAGPLKSAGAAASQSTPKESSVELAHIQYDLNRSKDTAQALTRLQELLQKDPNNVEARMTCGKVLQLLGYEGLADEQYRIVDQLDPTQPNSVLALFHSKLENEGPLAAGEYIRYVQKRFPHDASVLLMQGIIERMNGREETAEFYYREAMNRYPNTPGLASALASLRISQKRYLDALSLAERDLKLNKDHPAANLAKGEALLALGHPAEAVPYIRVAMKYPKNDKRAISTMLARAYMDNGQFSDAIEPTLVGLANTSMRDTETISSLKRRLRLILTQAKASEVLNTMQVVQRDMRDSEDAATVYFAIGDVLDRANHPKEAELAFTRGLALRPYSARPYLRVGMIKEENADYLGAFNSYALAYQLDKKNDRQIAARLTRIYRRSLNQNRDIAWTIRDLLHGGRSSEIDTKKIVFQML